MIRTLEVYKEFNKSTSTDEYLFIADIDDKRYMYMAHRGEDLLKWFNSCLKNLKELLDEASKNMD